MTLVFDTSVLSCFARAERLELLDELTKDHGRRVTTKTVIGEIEYGIPEHPSLRSVATQTWLERVQVASLEELTAYAVIAGRFVDAEGRNKGEASALAGGARFPCSGGSDFIAWANREGLL